MTQGKDHKKLPSGKGKKMGFIFMFNGLLLLVAFILIEYSVQRGETTFAPQLKGEFARAEVLPEPKEIPDFSFRKIGQEQEISLSDFRGKWILFNLWATWCPPCVEELPSLQKLQHLRADKNLKVIAVSLDHNMDEERLADFFERKEIDAEIAHYWDESGLINRKAGLESYPTTWVIDPQGKVRAIYAFPAEWASIESQVFIDSFLIP